MPLIDGPRHGGFPGISRMPKTSRSLRYAIYTRQSTDTVAAFSSCDAQFAVCRDFAKETGEPGLYWCGQRFDDQGYSGATLDRPALWRLRKVIDLGGIDRLYAVALDRLSRRLADTTVLLGELERAGVVLCLVHQPELGQAAESRFLRHILASFAEFEREMIAGRLAETRSYLKKHGRRLAGSVPFGYDADPGTKQLVPNLYEARRVRAIFKRAAAGQRPAEIARHINHLGWRTKQLLSRRSGRSTGGGRWTPRQIVELLRNPAYSGLFRDGRKTRPGCHEPIVDAALFSAAGAALDARRTTAAPRHRTIAWPLRGKLMCPKCGRAMTSHTVTRGTRIAKTVYRYYRCRSTAGGRPPCPNIQYSAYEVEKAVCDMLTDETAWRQMLMHRPFWEDQAGVFRTAWQALNEVEQRRMLPQVVDQVKLDPKRQTMTVGFSDALVAAVKAAAKQTGDHPRGARRRS
jgi:site-specific DNA recombinase